MVRPKSSPKKMVTYTPTPKPPKNAPGAPARREAEDYARTNLVISRRAFQGVMDDIVSKISGERKIDIEYSPLALHATQQAVERFVTDLLIEANYIAELRTEGGKYQGEEGVIRKSDIHIAQRMLVREM